MSDARDRVVELALAWAKADEDFLSGGDLLVRSSRLARAEVALRAAVAALDES